MELLWVTKLSVLHILSNAARSVAKLPRLCVQSTRSTLGFGMEVTGSTDRSITEVARFGMRVKVESIVKERDMPQGCDELTRKMTRTGLTYNKQWMFPPSSSSPSSS